LHFALLLTPEVVQNGALWYIALPLAWNLLKQQRLQQMCLVCLLRTFRNYGIYFFPLQISYQLLFFMAQKLGTFLYATRYKSL